MHLAVTGDPRSECSVSPWGCTPCLRHVSPASPRECHFSGPKRRVMSHDHTSLGERHRLGLRVVGMPALRPTLPDRLVLRQDPQPPAPHTLHVHLRIPTYMVKPLAAAQECFPSPVLTPSSPATFP